MNLVDEKLICVVECGTLRFHYSHHPETDWVVGMLEHLPDQRGVTATVLERALTEEEAGAMLDAYYRVVLRPYTYGPDRSESVVAFAFAVIFGLVVGALIYAYITSLIF